ncbi:Zn-dependent exopeptidase [Tothia fuscella]|uniref:Peptide hydrolase n=1 Tax=Tothia fuscella TaxID=1048955 RepID=A0A9P4U0R6_9PEZI|nr:Zn-dependent exopeptidase [Tothia fuscella]
MLVAGLRLFAILSVLLPLVSADAQRGEQPQPSFFKPLVTSRTLQSTIKLQPLLTHAKALEQLAYASPLKNRLMGTKGHNDTVTYLYNQLTSPALGGYYNVTIQPWQGVVQVSGVGSFSTNNAIKNVTVAQFSPSGNVTSTIVAVSNLGCNATDFPTALVGTIALISRGDCTFVQKSASARKAGAIGVIIYNNLPGAISGITLGTDVTTYGPPAPTLGISREDGLAVRDSIVAGTVVTGTLYVKTEIVNAITYNVLAQSKGGDPNSVLVLGAHTDSVEAGPGINDDGSGTVGILEVAKQLAKYRVRNGVRFGFWSGEEEGLLGSTYYVDHLPASEKKKIKLYLNFDMIASPNHIYGIFDGDGGDFNITGPTGSADIESLYESYFEGIDQNYTSIAFNGRSDYDPFIKVGIPAGGIETGAEGNKTADEQEQFGGKAGVAYDINYHGPGDNVTNLNLEAFLVNTKAIAHGVATYARSFSSVTFNDTEDATEDLKKRTVIRKSLGLNKKARLPKEKLVVKSRRYRNEVWL